MKLYNLFSSFIKWPNRTFSFLPVTICTGRELVVSSPPLFWSALMPIFFMRACTRHLCFFLKNPRSPLLKIITLCRSFVLRNAWISLPLNVCLEEKTLCSSQFDSALLRLSPVFCWSHKSIVRLLSIKNCQSFSTELTKLCDWPHACHYLDFQPGHQFHR